MVAQSQKIAYIHKMDSFFSTAPATTFFLTGRLGNKYTSGQGFETFLTMDTTNTLARCNKCGQ